jgi:hypothetical protein
MPEPVPGVVRVTTPRLMMRPSMAPRSIVRTQRTQPPSLLPLLIPASIAAAAFLGKLFSRKKPPENAATIEWQAEIVALVVTRSEK